MSSNPPPVEIRDSRTFYASFAVGVALLGGLATIGAGLGAFGLILVGGYAFWSVTRCIDRRPRLRITAEGLVDEIFWFSPGLIRWEDIVDVRTTHLGLIEVELKDETAFWERLSPLSQLVRIKWRLFGIGPAAITPWGLEQPEAGLAALLEDKLDEFTVSSARHEMSVGPGQQHPGKLTSD